jgi:hypothetical protein
MLFAVMIIIGGVTYTLVLNLENTTRSIYNYYNVLKKQAVKRMKGDTEAWKVRAKKYENFEPVPTDTKPSEWWVLGYVIAWPFKIIIRMIVLRKTKAQSSRPSTPPGPPPNTSSDTDNEDWLESFPDIPDEDAAENPISASQNPIDEITSAASPEKGTALDESRSAPAKAGDASTGHISGLKRNSKWLRFRSYLPRSTHNEGDIDGERVV